MQRVVVSVRRLRTARPCAAGIVAALLALAAACASAQPPWRFSGAPRIVAVGDVHGAYDALTGLLRATGLVDAELAWSGGAAHLVSLGDLLDRGAESRAVMDLLMRLEREADAAGGRVHVVLGNHELMNLIGDLRYVTDAEYAAFAADEPAAVRTAAYERFVDEHGADAAGLEAEFEQRYPPGYFGHRLAFAADGTYGAWLASRPALVVVDGTAFVHGGLPELVARSGLGVNDEIQRLLQDYLAARAELAAARVLPRYRMERDVELARAALAADPERASPHAATLERFVELAAAPALGADGPLWYRGSVYCNALLEEPVLDAALERLGATSVVVGHTPTADRRVHATYGGRLVMLDTGMLAEYYEGRPAALVIEDGERRVQYLAPGAGAGVEAGPVLAHGLTEPELVRVLAEAAVESVGGGAPAAVRLAHGAAPLEARFYAGDDAAAHELAAFALDRLLGLGLVPPTVAREIDGRAGALQLVFPDGVSETERLERRLPYGSCPIAPQAQLMYAFDLLTLNPGRTADTLRYRNALSNVVLVGHADAFGSRRSLPASLDVELEFPPALIDALEALDEPALAAALGETLDRRALRALLARRDALLELEAR